MVLWKETAFPLCRATKRRWKKECCLPGVFCDSGDTPANLLCELRGHLMPGTSCLYGKRVEDVCAGQFGVFVYLVLRCLVGCCTWFSCYYYLSTCLTRRYYRSVRSCAVCVRSVPSRCPVETLRAEISSLNDQLRSAAKRLASVDAIFRNKFTLFLQARAKSQLIRFTSHRQGLF